MNSFLYNLYIRIHLNLWSFNIILLMFNLEIKFLIPILNNVFPQYKFIESYYVNLILLFILYNTFITVNVFGILNL